MTYFPHNLILPPIDQSTGALGSVRQKTTRDVLWGRPLFKAPRLPSPRVAVDPLPFAAARVTRRPRGA